MKGTDYTSIHGARVLGLGCDVNAKGWSRICIGVAIACVLSFGGWWIVNWWTYEPWGDLERVTSTFPVPDGYELAGTREIGDRPAVCSIKPSCHDPALKVTYRQVSGRIDGCSAVQLAARKWEGFGFKIDDRNAEYFNIDPECVIFGVINGHEVQISSLNSDRSTVAIYIGY